MSSQGALRVTSAPLPPLAGLERDWRVLEARSEHSFFMSWHWIGSWLSLLPAGVPCRLLRAERGGATVGLAVLCEHKTRRHGVFSSRGLYLHRAGVQDLDELTIEYNGFLAESGAGGEVARAFIRHLQGQGGWDELYLSGWHQLDLLGDLAEAHDGATRSVRRFYYYVDLDELRREGRRYPERLPKNIQYNLRRSIRDYEKLGPLKFDAAGSTEEALAFLAGLKALHQRSWQARGEPGAFANRFFDEFHVALVRRLFAEGVIQLTRLAVGDRAVGYFYNFLYRGRLYHYQSGLDFEIDSKLSPGTVCHAHAVEYNLRAGTGIYDFMAGELKYKKDHATHSGEMLWLVLQRPRLKFMAEDWLRGTRDRLRGTAAKEAA